MDTFFHPKVQWRSQPKHIFFWQNVWYQASNSIFIWDTISQSTKWLDILIICGGMAPWVPPGYAYASMGVRRGGKWAFPPLKFGLGTFKMFCERPFVLNLKRISKMSMLPPWKNFCWRSCTQLCRMEQICTLLFSVTVYCLILILECSI